MIEEEQWRNVVGYELLYEVSSLGKIRRVEGGRANAKVGRILKNLTAKGVEYEYVHLFGYDLKSKTKRIHVLVAEAFLGPRPLNYQVNHIDGNKRNNNYQNLEYLTPHEHMRHTIEVLNLKRKFTDNDIDQMRYLREEEKFTYKDIADVFGVDTKTVWNILNGKVLYAIT